MVDAPNYSKYTLDELYDAKGHIDAARYPKRFAEIERQIARRLADVPPSEPKTRQPAESSIERLGRRTIGFYLIASAAISLVALLYRPQIDSSGVAMWAYAAIMLLFSAMLVGGVFLYRRHRVGLWVALPALCFQIPVFQIGRVGYTVMSFPSLEIKLWPMIGFAFSAAPTLHFSWHEAAQPLYLGMNVWATVAASLLAVHLERVERARERMRQASARNAG